MTFPEPLLRVWNINRRNGLPAWPHRRRSRRRHGRHTAPKKEERKRESERKNLTNHKQICSVCMRVCVLCEPHEQPQSSWPLRSVSKFCIWILRTIFRCATNFTCFYHLLICCSISLSHSVFLPLLIAQTFEISQIVTTTKCSPKKTCKHFVRSASCVQSIDERKYYYYYFFHSENSQLLHRENIHYICMWMYLLYIYRDFGLVCTQCLCFRGESFVQFVAEVTSNFSVISK